MVPRGNKWVKVKKEPIPDCSLTINDLEEGGSYKFRISAVNLAGTGNPCEPINITAKDQFGNILQSHSYFYI